MTFKHFTIMKKFFYTLLAVLILNSSNAQKQETLTNYSIMSLVKKGLSSSVIVSKIKQSICNFDVSTDALVFLKDNSVTDDIVNAMIEKTSVKTTENTSSTTQDASKENTQLQQVKMSPEAQKIINNMDGSGIYFFDEEKNVYTKLDPTVVSGEAMRANALIVNGGRPSSNSYLDGKEANVQINSQIPVFYFYFEQASTSLNNSRNKAEHKDNYMELIAGISLDNNTKAFSPNDFKLLELDTRKNSRYYRSDLAGTNLKIASGYFKDFKYEKVAPNLYKVFPKSPLDKKAEFCFIYAGNANKNIMDQYSTTNTNREIKVFDFGVNAKKK